MELVHVLGPFGSNGHYAATQWVKRAMPEDGADYVFAGSNVGIIRQVAQGTAHDIGVVPIENATAGLVDQVIAYWLAADQSPVHVCGELLMPVTHALLVHPRQAEAPITRVMSHPQALSQCARSLDERGIRHREPAESTSGAAQYVLDHPEESVAALASPLAAQYYGLHVVAPNLADSPDNATRFHIIRRHGALPLVTGHDRTALIFWVEDRPKVLANVLWAIGTQDVNMSSLHSIPLGSSRRYAFYCEFDAHQDDERGSTILEIMGHLTTKITILGSFPATSEGDTPWMLA